MNPVFLSGGGTSGGGGGCSASYGSELNTTVTCTAPTGISEGGVTTPWVNSACDTFNENGPPSLGTYALAAAEPTEGGTNGAGVRYSYSGLGLSAGSLYRIQVDYRHNGTDNSWKWGLGIPGMVYYAPTNIYNTETTYATHTQYLIYSAQLTNIVFFEASTDNNGGVYVDNVSIKPATLCYGDELNTNANATNTISDSNATTGFSQVGTPTLFESTSSNTPHGGTYHLHLTTAASTGIYSDLSVVPFSLVSGHKYLITVWAKHATSATGVNIGFSASAALPATWRYVVTVPNTVTTYTKYGVSFVYDSNHRYFSIGSTGIADIYVDDISIMEITGE
jgi:hypothetical protein